MKKAIRNELEKSSLVKGVSFCSHIPTFHAWGSVQLQSNQQSEPININQFAVDPDFIDNYQLQLVAGRDFSDQLITDQTESIILNQRATEILGYTSADQAIGEILELKNIFSKEAQRKVKIIGVVENFNYRSVIHTIGPLVLQYLPQAYQYAVIHYSRKDREAVKANLAELAEQFNGIHPLQYNFYEDMASAENRIMSSFVSIAAWCSGFIILIALMGLLGMAMYTTEIRIREVGIRRVLGATVTKIAYQLSQDYFKLVVMSSLIAIPLAWISSDYVMQSFAFRIELQWWVFIFVIIFVLGLALLTIGSQTVRAALANPVETLREE